MKHPESFPIPTFEQREYYTVGTGDDKAARKEASCLIRSRLTTPWPKSLKLYRSIGFDVHEK
jgi:hypothetical protein